jgi:8-oxo-dGTP pyrophosphatase MutT (NUDIX family)
MDPARQKKKKKRTYRQYAALPYKVRDGELVVMLVTSRETRRWVIPKGWPKRNRTPSGTAAEEAFEEAGIVGEVAQKPIKSYIYSKRLPDDTRRRCRVDVFLLAVHEVLEAWPEKGQRKREWVTPAQAALRVAEAGLIELFLNLALEEPG